MRLIPTLLICCLATGCATWKPIAHDQMVTTVDQRPSGRIRIDLGVERMELRKPSIQGDTLTGQRVDTDRPRLVSVPLSSVRSMELKPGGTRTTVMAVGIMSGLFVLFVTGALIAGPTKVY